MISTQVPLLLACIASVLTPVSASDYPTDLVGTWSSKSKKVLTGPGFYNPVTDRLIEPDLTGISYSFTSDGYYEEAYYRAIANPAKPSCPSSIMQWQHGTYTVESNGSLVLTPIAVDGRQILSEPCTYDYSTYTRYSQSEYMSSYEVLTDPYHNVQRLNLYEWDGTAMMPLYLVMTPPQMLPTITLNPTTTATTSGATVTGTGKAKRSLDRDQDVVQNRLLYALGWSSFLPSSADLADPNKWWWAGAGCVAVGSILFMWPTSV